MDYWGSSEAKKKKKKKINDFKPILKQKIWNYALSSNYSHKH